MAIGVYFRPERLDASLYQQAVDKLEGPGSEPAKGRQYHVCFGSGDKLQVFEIWDSQEVFEAYGQTLMPVLQEIGINPGEPMIEPVVRTIS